MQLTCREQTADDETLHNSAQGTILAMVMLSLALGMAVIAGGSLIPATVLIGLAGFFSLVILVARVFFTRDLSLRILALCLAVPVLTAVGVIVISNVMQGRISATLTLLVLSAIAMWLFGHLPIQFYQAWLLAAPHVSPEMRRRQKPIRYKISWRLLLAVIPIMLILPIFLPSLAILLVVALCSNKSANQPSTWSLASVARDVLTRFVSYDAISGAPGTWRPHLSVTARKIIILVILSLFFASITVPLCFFVPCRVVAPLMADDAGVLTKLNLPGSAALKEAMRNRSSDGTIPPFQLAEAMTDYPPGALLLSCVMIMTGKQMFSWILLLSFCLYIIVPPYVLIALYRPALTELAELRQKLAHDAMADPRPEWQWYVDHLRTSMHEASDPVTGRPVRESEHLFLGLEYVHKFPVLLDRRILAEHAYIVGDTGSGKTSLGIMPILIQLIRGHAEPREQIGSVTSSDNENSGNGDSWQLSAPPPIIIIDLKGDPALFHMVRDEAERRRRELEITDPQDPRYAFRFFTCEKERSTHYFNPFKSLESSTRSLSQICHLLLDSLNLSHGEGYGRSYYSRKNRMLLYEVLDSKPEVRSFEELYKRIAEREAASPQVYRDAFELVSTMHALSKYPQLATFQPLKRPADSVHLPSVLEHSQVAYFWLPAALESISVREIAKLALFSTLSAAIDRQVNGQPKRQAYVVIDEFQRIAGENFKVILEQARSFGLAAILANQTQHDLATADTDLRATIRTNTRFKQYFGLSDSQEIHDLCDASGQEVATMRSWMTSIMNSKSRTMKSEQEFIKTRLTVNDVLSASDHPLQSIVQVSRGDGYTQYGGFPVPIQSAWPLHQADYIDYQYATWPEREEYELETVVSEQAPAEIDRERDREAERKTAEISAKIEQLFADEEEAVD